MADTIAVGNDSRYMLLAELADSNGDITPLLETCDALWSSAEDRLWLVGAMLRRISRISTVPDEAAGEFLAKKAYATLGKPGLPADTSIGAAEHIAAVALQLPEEVWHQPRSWWPSLVKALADDLGIPEPSVDSPSVLPETVAIAEFVVSAVGQPWTDELEARLEQWRGENAYEWLQALRDAALNNSIVEAAHAEAVSEDPLCDTELGQRMLQETPFQRRRELVLTDEDARQTFWADPDPQVEADGREIGWRFRIPVVPASTRTISVTVQEQTVGRMTVTRSHSGEFQMQSARGILLPWLSHYQQPVVAAEAAAEATLGTDQMIQLGPTLWGAIEDLGHEILLYLRWKTTPETM